MDGCHAPGRKEQPTLRKHAFPTPATPASTTAGLPHGSAATVPLVGTLQVLCGVAVDLVVAIVTTTGKAVAVD